MHIGIEGKIQKPDDKLSQNEAPGDFKKLIYDNWSYAIHEIIDDGQVSTEF